MAETFFDRVHKNDSHTPDVLSCLSNLSNDEVFTPPELVNQMLDMLPQELFSDPNTKFLDPAAKTGVFLREIAKRLLVGLEPIYPNLQERIDHIFHEQLYGIAITELTSLLSRRSVYCSRYPNGQYSVTKFDNAEGNIRFKKIKHTWENGQCKYCGASKEQYDRSSDLETHAYEFIHLNNLKEVKNMKFDVIISNPPYQLSDGGHGASAIPIYQKFIQNAKKLNPRYLTMITPSRWFTGGRGLNDFREEMLNDERIKIIHDFPNASDCFPGVEIKGGVSYFLWDSSYKGKCKIYTHERDKAYMAERPLLEDGLDIFIRDSRSISILNKVLNKNEEHFYNIMSANDPFGYDVRVENSYLRVKPDYKKQPFKDSLQFYYNGWRKDGIGYIDKSTVRKGFEYVDKYKLLIPRAFGSGETKTDRLNPILAKPKSVCTETYSVIGPFDNEEICKNVISYINTRFFHFLVSIVKITQAAAKHVYKYVPMQDFSKPWTDDELFKKYGFSKEDIEYIESSVWPEEVKENAD